MTLNAGRGAIISWRSGAAGGALLTETPGDQELRPEPLGEAHCNIRDGLLGWAGVSGALGVWEIWARLIRCKLLDAA
jgi:hypothetical protein